MAKIKICGITRKEDIEYVNKYVPEFTGFVFANSRRKVTPEGAAELIKNLDSRIKRAGVFVNERIDDVVSISRMCRLDVVQIHGDETGNYITALKGKLDNMCDIGCPGKRIEIWKGVRVRDINSLNNLKSFNSDAFLLDAYVEGSYGGAGKTFNWELAHKAREFGKIIIAGGLDQNNVLKARDEIQPYALDVSSGVETDGFKDEVKIKNFICIARSY
jgi:phosphoribosylanthranilate isomerase